MARVVEERKSRYSGVVKVVKDMSGVRLVAGELDQSGGAVVGVLRDAIGVAKKISEGLILGMGGGTGVKLIRKRFPMARLTCVEIDPVMVELAEKYFGLTEGERLQIVCEDAARWVKEYQVSSMMYHGKYSDNETTGHKIHNTKYIIHDTRFDFILVDCYLGGEVPKQCETEEFLTGVRSLLADDGVAVVNRLFYDAETRRKAQEFVFRLEPVFGKIDLRRSGSNMLIVCGKADWSE